MVLPQPSGNNFTVKCPEAQEFARKQPSVFWPHWEVDVDGGDCINDAPAQHNVYHQS